MWNFFLKNDRFSYIIIIALVVVGVFSMLTIPRESTPEVEVPYGVVSVALPGAPAQDIEALITNEIESAVQNIEGVKKFTSTSQKGSASVAVEFEAQADLDKSIQDLKDAVDTVVPDLPKDATDPYVAQVDFVNQPILSIAIASDIHATAFAELADQVEDELEQVTGVSDATIAGVQTPEITVLVESAKLAQFSLSIQDITSAISTANSALPIGSIEHDNTSYNIAFEGKPKNATDIENIAVTTRGGQSVLVRDVATVVDGLSPKTTLARLSVDGQPSMQSMSVSVYKQTGGDITRIAKAVNERLTKLQSDGELLADANVEVLSDAGADIDDDLKELATSGLQTVLLVFIALVVAIGWREGLIAGTAVPLSFLIGFIGLKYSGNTINFLSLFSLILGIGILVDSAIVMVEGINKRMKENAAIDKQEAARLTVKSFAAPLTSGTLTTIAMFAGLFIVSGITGEFIESIPFTLIFLLLASLFVSLAIVPLFAAAFLRRRSATSFEQKQFAYAQKLEAWYKSKLQTPLTDEQTRFTFFAAINALFWFSIGMLLNVYVAVIAGVLLFFVGRALFRLQARRGWAQWPRLLLYMLAVVVIGFVGYKANPLLPQFAPVPVIFFESSDVPYIFVDVEAKSGTTKEQTDIAVRQVEDILYTEANIASFRTTVGSGNEYAGGGESEKLANIFVLLTEERDETSLELADRLQAKVADIPEVTIEISQPDSGPPTGAPVLVKFIGNDITELQNAAAKAGDLLREMPGTKNVTVGGAGGGTEYLITLDTLKAATLGLSSPAVSSALRSATFGADATTLTSLSDDVDVVVKLNNNPENTDPALTNNTTIDNILRTEIQTQSGSVPLSEVADVSLQAANESIAHEGGKRVITVEAEVTEDGNAIQITSDLLTKIETELDLPSGMSVSTGGGEAEETNKAFAEMFGALIVGMLLMVLVLVLQFNSFLHTRYVLSILPYSLIGVLGGLALTGNALSFPAIMGFIALSGIIVNNSILLIDSMNEFRREKPDANMREVILDAAGSRLRPILLTTVTTVLGMIPLTYADPVWAPLAFSVMFGLIFSVIITLVLVPIVYYRKPGELTKADEWY